MSGTNEYSVKPLALVSTVAPPIVAVFRAVPDELALAEAAEEARAAGELLELGGPGVDRTAACRGNQRDGHQPKGAHLLLSTSAISRSKRTCSIPSSCAGHQADLPGVRTGMSSASGQDRLSTAFRFAGIGPAWAAEVVCPAPDPPDSNLHRQRAGPAPTGHMHATTATLLDIN